MKAVRDHFALQGGTGTSLETPSRARASSSEEVGTTWCFSSCGGILVLRRGSQPSPWVGPGKPNLPLGSCLENPRDWGAWWASIYGVAQSRT